jgi:hypothetical protein
VSSTFNKLLSAVMLFSSIVFLSTPTNLCATTLLYPEALGDFGCHKLSLGWCSVKPTSHAYPANLVLAEPSFQFRLAISKVSFITSFVVNLKRSLLFCAFFCTALCYNRVFNWNSKLKFIRINHSLRKWQKLHQIIISYSLSPLDYQWVRQKLLIFPCFISSVSLRALDVHASLMPTQSFIVIVMFPLIMTTGANYSPSGGLNYTTTWKGKHVEMPYKYFKIRTKDSWHLAVL